MSRSWADLKPAAIAHDQSDEAMTDLDVEMKAIVDDHFIRVSSRRQNQLAAYRETV
jgi:proteic killer suppression protein